MSPSTLTRFILLASRPVPVPISVPAGRRPRPVPAMGPRRPRPGLLGGLVTVEWDAFRGVHVAVCDRCCESLDALGLDQAHDFAESHRCDPELVALLADVLNLRAAA